MPQFQNTFSYADLGTFVLLIVAFISIFLLGRRHTKQSNAALFKELYLMVFGDADFGDAFFLIEKGQFVYGATAAYSPQERMVSRLLRFMDLVCEVYADKMLTEQEMSFFKRQFIGIYEHPSIKGYLKFLTEDYTAAGVGTTPFPHFVAYCEQALPPRAAPAAAGSGNHGLGVHASSTRPDGALPSIRRSWRSPVSRLDERLGYWIPNSTSLRSQIAWARMRCSVRNFLSLLKRITTRNNSEAIATAGTIATRKTRAARPGISCGMIC